MHPVKLVKFASNHQQRTIAVQDLSALEAQSLKDQTEAVRMVRFANPATTVKLAQVFNPRALRVSIVPIGARRAQMASASLDITVVVNLAAQLPLQTS